MLERRTRDGQSRYTEDITMLLLPVADEGNGIVERLLAWVSLKNEVGTPHV